MKKLVLLLVCGLLWQSPAPQFRARVDLVILDVTVLDKNRRPVLGLTADDFIITEHGKPQSVSTFEAIEIESAPAATAEWLKAAPVDVAVNRHDEGRGRMVVLVIDDATLPFDPYMMNRAKDTAKAFIEGLGPDDQCAVVFTRDNRNAQDFTSDRSRLLKAASRISAGFIGAAAGPGARFDTDLNHYLSSVNTLSRVAEHLGMVSARRKTIAYLSIGIPANPDALGQITLIGAGGSPIEGEIQRAYVLALRKAIDRAQRANVAIYALDPSGLDGIESYNRRNRRIREPTVGPLPGGQLFRNTLQTLANATGGRAFIQNNDFKPGLAQLFVETGSYYLLGYAPSPLAKPGEYRRVDVKTKRPGLEVVTRTGYFGAPVADTTRPAPPGEQKAIAGVLPDPGVPLRAAALPVVLQDGSPGVVLTVALDRDAAGVAAGDQVEIATHFFDVEGRPKEDFSQTARVCANPGWCEMSSLMAVKPGKRAVRVGVRHVASNTSGSVYLDVDVPDPLKQPFSMSGIAMTASPAWAATSDEVTRKTVPLLPTTRRDFSQTDTVTFFVRISQRKDRAPLTRKLRIVNSAGETVVSLDRPLAANDFAAAGFVDDRMLVSLEKLPKGRYLVQVDLQSAGGTTPGRQLSFAIR